MYKLKSNLINQSHMTGPKLELRILSKPVQALNKLPALINVRFMVQSFLNLSHLLFVPLGKQC